MATCAEERPKCVPGTSPRQVRAPEPQGDPKNNSGKKKFAIQLRCCQKAYLRRCVSCAALRVARRRTRGPLATGAPNGCPAPDLATSGLQSRRESLNNAGEKSIYKYNYGVVVSCLRVAVGGLVVPSRRAPSAPNGRLAPRLAKSRLRGRRGTQKTAGGKKIIVYIVGDVIVVSCAALFDRAPDRRT